MDILIAYVCANIISNVASKQLSENVFQIGGAYEETQCDKSISEQAKVYGDQKKFLERSRAVIEEAIELIKENQRTRIANFPEIMRIFAEERRKLAMGNGNIPPHKLRKSFTYVRSPDINRYVSHHGWKNYKKNVNPTHENLRLFGGKRAPRDEFFENRIRRYPFVILDYLLTDKLPDDLRIKTYPEKTEKILLRNEAVKLAEEKIEKLLKPLENEMRKFIRQNKHISDEQKEEATFDFFRKYEQIVNDNLPFKNLIDLRTDEEKKDISNIPGPFVIRTTYIYRLWNDFDRGIKHIIAWKEYVGRHSFKVIDPTSHHAQTVREHKIILQKKISDGRWVDLGSIIYVYEKNPRFEYGKHPKDRNRRTMNERSNLNDLIQINFQYTPAEYLDILLKTEVEQNLYPKILTEQNLEILVDHLSDLYWYLSKMSIYVRGSASITKWLNCALINVRKLKLTPSDPHLYLDYLAILTPSYLEFREYYRATYFPDGIQSEPKIDIPNIPEEIEIFDYFDDLFLERSSSPVPSED